VPIGVVAFARRFRLPLPDWNAARGDGGGWDFEVGPLLISVKVRFFGRFMIIPRHQWPPRCNVFMLLEPAGEVAMRFVSWLWASAVIERAELKDLGRGTGYVLDDKHLWPMSVPIAGFHYTKGDLDEMKVRTLTIAEAEEIRRLEMEESEKREMEERRKMLLKADNGTPCCHGEYFESYKNKDGTAGVFVMSGDGASDLADLLTDFEIADWVKEALNRALEAAWQRRD
jgi:hypothetical protein